MIIQNQTSTPSAPLSIAHDTTDLLGRVLLGAIFLISGLGKIAGHDDIGAYMAAVGVPRVLLPLVIATEVLGAIAIILGYKTRLVAFLLAGFTLLAGVTFHRNIADQNEFIHLLKNLAITGGFLVLLRNGAGALSIDRHLEKKRLNLLS